MFKFEEGKTYLTEPEFEGDTQIDFKVTCIDHSKIRLLSECKRINKKILSKEDYEYFKPYTYDPEIIVTAKQIKGED